MLAGWAAICIKEFYTCMEYMKDFDKINEYKERLDKMAKAMNEVAWEGDWYQRATHDSGWVLGAKDSKYGKLWMNPNSFAILAGIADEEKTQKILAAFDKYLDTEYGPYGYYPPIAEPDKRYGIISRFMPGTKENGAFFSHSSKWRIWLECFVGRGDKAYEVLNKMSPITRHAADPDVYKIEPYVACQFIATPESGYPGEGSHSWATGSAAWTLVVVWEWILGVRPEVEGLRIDPCMPSHWTTARMTRPYRGATYEIEFSKREGICKGKVTVELDGVKLENNLIKPQGDGKVHTVKVTLE